MSGQSAGLAVLRKLVAIVHRCVGCSRRERTRVHRATQQPPAGPQTDKAGRVDVCRAIVFSFFIVIAHGSNRWMDVRAERQQGLICLVLVLAGATIVDCIVDTHHRILLGTAATTKRCKRFGRHLCH